MNKSKPLIGELLRTSGFITQSMLDCGLKVKSSGGTEKLGQILKSLGFVTDVELAKVLAKQTGLKYFSMDKFSPEAKVIELVPYKYAQKYNILPVMRSDKTTTVAVADPYSVQTLQYVRQFVPEPINIVVAPLNLLQRAVESRYYLASHPIQSAIDQIVAEVNHDEKLRTADLIRYLNHSAIELNASDMHISTTGKICFISYRVDGVLQLRYTFPSIVHSRVISAYKLECGMDITESLRAQDGQGSFELLGSTYELRVSSMPTVHGENLVVRYLTTSQEFRSVEDLGFTSQQLETLKKYLDVSSGVILCTGPTGSGKTTTLYGLVRRTNYMERNVLTVEDPVEFKIPLIKQVSVNEKAGITFSSAIKSFLRQDPDIILIGEIRDEDTALLAIRAAQTGHLMMSSLHTNDAIGSIARLRDLGVGNYLIASTLSCVIAQRLVRKLCPICKTQARVPTETVEKLGLKGDLIYRKNGCNHCFGTGYLGRIAVAEILEMSPRIKAMVEEGASPMELRKQMEEDGTVTLNQRLAQLVQAGITDDEEYHRVTYE